MISKYTNVIVLYPTDPILERDRDDWVAAGGGQV